MSFPLINPTPTFLDSSGSPLASGTIEFRSPSTNDLINSFPTADDADAQTNANDNPLILNARGEAPNGLFLEEGVAYKVILKDSSDTTIWTQDDVKSPTVATEVVKNAAEIASGVTIVDASYVPGHFLRYGKNTNPGTTDFSAAAAAAIANSDIIRVPAEAFFVPGGLTVPANKTVLGEGYLSQIITTAADDNTLTVTGSNVLIENLRVTSGGKTLNESEATLGNSIWLKGISTSNRLENISVNKCYIDNGHIGINADYVDHIKITKNHFLNTNTGWSQMHIWDCKHGVISNNTMDGTGVMGNHIGLWGPTALAEKCENMTVSINTMVDCTFEAIQLMGSNNDIIGNTLTHLSGLATSVGVQVRSKGILDDTKGNNVSDNTIKGFRYGIFLHHFDDIDTEGPKNTTLSDNNIADGIGYGYLIKHKAYGTNINGGNVSGILNTFLAGDGVRIQSDRVKCNDVNVSGCANDGIAVSGARSNVSICYNDSNDNTGDGISGSASATGTKIIGNTTLDNGGWGIQPNGSLSRIESNDASGNTSGQINSSIPALDDTGTPSIAGSKVWRTGGTTQIDDLDDGNKGDTRTIHCEHTVTFSVAGSLNGGTTNLDAVDGDMIQWEMDNNGATWNLIAFVRNGIDNSGGA